MTVQISQEDQKYIGDLEKLLNFTFDELNNVEVTIYKTRLKPFYLYLLTGNAFTNASAILSLLKDAKTIACNNLLRTLVEDFINIHYIYCARSEDNLLRYLVFDAHDRKELAKRVKDYLTRNPNSNNYLGTEANKPEYWDAFATKLDAEIELIKKKKKRVSVKNLPDLRQRAQEVDKIKKTKLEWWYINLYWLFSIHTHATLRGINAQMKNHDKVPYFELEGNMEEIRVVAITSYMILYTFVDMCFDKFHLEKSRLREHKATFMSYSGKKLRKTRNQP